MSISQKGDKIGLKKRQDKRFAIQKKVCYTCNRQKARKIVRFYYEFVNNKWNDKSFYRQDFI